MPSPRLYHINQDGEMLGEFTEEQARHYLDEGSLHPDDLAWCTGMATWQPLQILFLTPELPPPPLPGTSPSITSLPLSPVASSVTPPPLPHERPRRTVVKSKAPPPRAMPPELPGKSNLPTPIRPNVEKVPPPYRLEEDKEFIPVHMRPRYTLWGPLFTVIGLVLLMVLLMLFGAHFTGQQELLLRLFPVLAPEVDWLIQNVPGNPSVP
ncbi:DUF4339 domain-containing protein [Prosthecobacter sp. SYSU 5D2]|uniref:DUF4339 domain-containing protein n=1 Tax=Prosthecobacter sp. SYSU 5D2 TaxID=3134134 RepID=UPI0031FE4533